LIPSQPDPQLVKLFTEALSRQTRGDLGPALLYYRRIQRQYPDFIDGWALAAALLCELGRFEEALDSAERAVALDGENQAAVYVLASSRLGLGQADEAEALLLGLIKAAPSHFQALLDLADLYAKKGMAAESREAYDRAVGIRLTDPRHLSARGSARLHALDLPGAEADFKAAMGLGLGDRAMRMRLACLLLLRGSYREAWRLFVPGMALATMYENYDTGNTRWDGGPMPGRTLMVRTYHHGFGDVIQFARFLPQVKEMSRARVLLSVYGPILRLLKGLPGVDGLLVQEKEEPPFDAVINLFELPMLLDVESTELPPPIVIPPLDDAGFMPELDRPGFKVGLVWGGNRIHTMDEHRSMNPRLLDALADMQGVERIAWYGLQKPPDPEPPRLPGFMDMSPRMGDFMDTAQIVRRLDLVVSVDTSTLHLAGSLRVPTIAMLPRIPEWRWCLDEATPWYPTVRLLRQPRDNDWKGAVELLKAEIARRAQSRYNETTAGGLN